MNKRGVTTFEQGGLPLQNGLLPYSNVYSFVVTEWASWHEQRFPPNSLPKLHALQSTLTIFHGIITVSHYRQTVKPFE